MMLKWLSTVQAAFPSLVKAGSLVHLTHPDQVESAFAAPGSPLILMIVGAIPSFAPVTSEERMVYTTVSSILSIPYSPSHVANPKSKGDDALLPIPTRRLFLEMAYKPRRTPMVRFHELSLH
jgi:quinate dehydrogenase